MCHRGIVYRERESYRLRLTTTATTTVRYYLSSKQELIGGFVSGILLYIYHTHRDAGWLGL